MLIVKIKFSKNPRFVGLIENRPVSGISENSVASVAAISRTLTLMQRHKERKFTRSAASFPTKSGEVYQDFMILKESSLNIFK